MAVNPSLFGEDLEVALWRGVGLAGTAAVNKMIAPVARGLVPGVANADNAMAKGFNALTTALSAFVGGEILEQVDANIGRYFRQGGMVLAMGRAAAILIPGFSIDGGLPEIRGGNPAPAALAPGQTMVTPGAPPPPTYSMNVPTSNVSAPFAVGL